MAQFVSGRIAGKDVPGICDRCGQRVSHNKLKVEYKQDKPTGIMVCPSCWDDQHPQDDISPIAIDAQRVKDPRPDPGLRASRSMSGWEPVGNPATDLSMGESKAFAN